MIGVNLCVIIMGHATANGSHAHANSLLTFSALYLLFALLWAWHAGSTASSALSPIWCQLCAGYVAKCSLQSFVC